MKGSVTDPDTLLAFRTAIAGIATAGINLLAVLVQYGKKKSELKSFSQMVKSTDTRYMKTLDRLSTVIETLSKDKK
ncbi:MAG: hypothetical protein QOG04_235 [Actinomycetota bacterium]|jgi:hypothetical protein|nr:hypothetical protein [Actinomycetota bacterium]